MLLQACTFYHVILVWQPSDAAYTITRDVIHKHLLVPYKHHFKVTYTQLPNDKLKKKTKKPPRTLKGTARAMLAFGGAPVLGYQHSIQKLRSKSERLHRHSERVPFIGYE